MCSVASVFTSLISAPKVRFSSLGTLLNSSKREGIIPFLLRYLMRSASTSSWLLACCERTSSWRALIFSAKDTCFASINERVRNPSIIPWGGSKECGTKTKESEINNSTLPFASRGNCHPLLPNDINQRPGGILSLYEHL